MSLHRTGTLVMEQEQKSNNKSQSWGKLVPISQGLSSVQISTDSFSIGRNPQCTLMIHDKRLSGKHCQITKKGTHVSITDLSTNGTYVGDKRIGKNKTQELQDNQQIWLLPSIRVNPTQTLGYKIQFLFERKKKQHEQKQKIQKKQKQQEQQKHKKQQQEKKQKEKKKKEQEQANKKNDFSKSLKQQITCAYCFEIMFIPISVQPCNHRFCGACLTQLVNAKKQQCIICRKELTTGARDSIFNSIIEDYLKSHSDQKRSQKEEQQAKKNNIFGHEPIDIQERIHGKKVPAKTKAVIDPPARNAISKRGRGRGLVRASSDLSASDDQDSGKKCRQCDHPRNGFQCSKSQVHVACHTCGKLMANRDDPKLHQHCVICTTNFCNLYFPPCSRSGVKLQLLKDKRGAVKIDAQLLRGNKFEFEGIKNFLLSKKQTSKDVFDFILKKVQKKQFSYLFDKKIMKIPPLASKQVQLDSDSAICDLCWKDLWFQMVFAYRTALSAEMPSSVRDRPVCYWGVNCRTMDHNHDHAKKYNHFVFQTRFS